MGDVINEVDPADPAVQHLRELWDITQDPDTDLATKLELVFDRESRKLELPYGFLTRTDPATDTQTIETARGAHELLAEGETAPLSESYCRKTIASPDGVFHIDHASEEGWEDDPAYERFQLETYLGARVEFDGEVFGTICLAGSSPRAKPISDGERMLIDMLATWVSSELNARSPKERFEHQSRQFEEIVSVVSHDLRNPLSVAQGHVAILNESIQESIGQIESAHDRMNEIIDNMLTLAQVDEPLQNPEPVALCPCARRAWEMVKTDEATLSLACDGVDIRADEQRLKHLFENLFRNAVEHGPDAVTVEVGVTDSGFYVSDDGHGIPPSERPKVFEPGYSSDSEGTGFGLNIVQRIAAAHGWDVTITESSMGGARFEFTLMDSIPSGG